MTMTKLSSMAVGIALFAMACADATSPKTTTLQITRPSAAVSDQIGGYPTGMEVGEVRVCKTVPAGDPAGVTFTFAVTTVVGVVPSAGQVTTTTNHNIVGVPGQSVCVDVFDSQKTGAQLDSVRIVESAPPANWALAAINTVRIDDGPGYTPPNSGANSGDLVVENVGARSVSLYINGDMGRIVTFTNDHTPPGVAPVCDFITFGRLVIEVGGEKVVISGNAGGINADQSIKNEFHIDANDIDNHVANAFTYGPIASGPLSGAGFPNSRVVTGTAKNGVAVELRLWDGGEPGKGTDRVWVSLGGNILIGGANGALIDQGNMQYHPNCRGPG